MHKDNREAARGQLRAHRAQHGPFRHYRQGGQPICQVELHQDVQRTAHRRRHAPFYRLESRLVGPGAIVSFPSGPTLASSTLAIPHITSTYIVGEADFKTEDAQRFLEDRLATISEVGTYKLSNKPKYWGFDNHSPPRMLGQPEPTWRPGSGQRLLRSRKERHLVRGPGFRR